MATSTQKQILYWTGGIVLSLVVGALIIARWMQLAGRERADLIERQREALAWDRAKFQEYWGNKISWHPDAKAVEALAVTPRSKFNDFDAIYVLFRGDKGSSVLAVTQIGGYFNLATMNAHDFPDTLIDRKITEAESRDLALLIELMDQRATAMDKQSERRGWNSHVVDVARKLQRLQSAFAPSTTSQTLNQ